ncbi:isocitrate lyase/PEP mutase family protein [Glycomyces tarimensis]
MTINEKAARFRALHTTPALRLVNCWDAGSAAVIEAAGAPAVATASAGVNWSLGYPDGGAVDRAAALAAIARIARAVSVPVTADIESGYGETPSDVAETAAAVVEAGVVGVNIEDAAETDAAPLRETADQAERIAAVRAATGSELYINARVDTYLLGVGEEAGRLEATVARAKAYLEAGASGIFVPGVTDAGTIAALVEAIAAPLNVMAGPGSLAPSELDKLGVARISTGPGVTAAAYALARRATIGLLEDDSYDALGDGVDYGTMNGMLRA